jgi:hypothetical protein
MATPEPSGPECPGARRRQAVRRTVDVGPHLVVHIATVVLVVGVAAVGAFHGQAGHAPGHVIPLVLVFLFLHDEVVVVVAVDDEVSDRRQGRGRASIDWDAIIPIHRSKNLFILIFIFLNEPDPDLFPISNPLKLHHFS